MRAKRFVEATRAHVISLVRRGARSQLGFTLAELLVVVGIVVGLAAVILPNVGRFTGKGAEGASATEHASVQTAFDAWAIEVGPIPAGPTNARNDFIGASAPDLVLYLRLAGGATQTGDYYCWDGDGTVVQYATAFLCP